MNLFLHQNIANYNNLDEILYSPLLVLVRDHDMPFHLENEKYKNVENIGDAKIIPLLHPPLILRHIISSEKYLDIEYTLADQADFIGTIDKSQWLIIMMHTHASEFVTAKIINENVKSYSFITNNVLVVDLNRNCSSIQHIFYDFNFNLVKALYTEYDKFDFRNRKWTYSTTKDSFVLDEIKIFNLSKRFLIPNIIRDSPEFKEVVRKRIKSEIIQEHDCYFSDPPNNIFLEPKEPHCVGHYGQTGIGNIPISDYYYYKSAVSVFSETICSCNTGVKVISEKTFTPLIRGHYILPYGYCGMIADIKSYGFLLPDWIDYSYDVIDNDIERLNKFIESANRLRSLTLSQLEEKTNQDLNLLKFNRSLFFTKPYDSLYMKIKDRIFKLEKLSKR